MVNSFNLPGKEIYRWNLKEFDDDNLNKTVLLITVLYLGTYVCEFTIRITHKKTRQQTRATPWHYETEIPSLTRISLHLTWLTRILINTTFSKTKSSINQGVDVQQSVLKVRKSQKQSMASSFLPKKQTKITILSISL